MKLRHWRSQAQQAEPTASQLVPALERVREMREHSAWEPLTSANTSRERAERVSKTRRQITVPPLAGERRRKNEIFEYPVRLWLREAFEALLVVIAGAVIALVFLLVRLALFAN